MKSGIAMMLHALLRTKTGGMTPAGDIVLAVVSDEESGGDQGVRYLVEDHPELFAGIKYAIGEFGGFSFQMGGWRFYPIMVAEKQVCHLRATFQGTGSHASLAAQHKPMTEMARFLQRVQSRQFPTHVTPEARIMFQAIGRHVSLPVRAGIVALLNPRFTALTLRLMGVKSRTFSPLFRNTVNPTSVRGGGQIDVVPDEVSVGLDGGILPHLSPELLMSELRGIAGPASKIEVLSHDSGLQRPDLGLFETLSDVLKESDPDGIPVPMLMPAATEGRLFACLGIRTYGFLPMLLPETLDFAATIHGSDERVPVDAINFGAGAIYRLLQRYGRTL